MSTTPVEVVQGASADVLVGISQQDPKQGEVLVSLTSLPAGVHSEQISIQPGETMGTLTIRADLTAAQGVVGGSLSAAYADSTAAKSQASLLSVLVRGKPGTLDETFGDKGVYQSAGLENAQLKALKQQADGKVVFVGHSDTAPGVRVGRLNADGSLDQTFATTGVLTTNAEGDTTYSSDPLTVIVQPAGTILVVSSTQVSGAAQVAFTRITAQGQPDPGFGTNGTVLIAAPAGVALRAANDSGDGKVLVVGSRGKLTNLSGGVGRYGQDGTVDAFGTTGGWAFFDKSLFSAADSVFPQAVANAKTSVDVSVVVQRGDAQFTRPALLRYAADGSGSPLATEASIGVVKETGGPQPVLEPALTERASSGPVLGLAIDGTVTLFAFKADGTTIDTSFGMSAAARTDAGKVASNLVEDGSGRLIYPVVPTSLGAFQIERQTPSGTLDQTFGEMGNGITTADVGGSGTAQTVAVLLQKDGRLLVGGSRTLGDTYGMAFARFWP